MSRVRRLSLIGVRNFGDEKEEEIRFTRPLTLIIGDNGVGKTTIIEALRYASTGEFPPGSDRGKGFIHDPSLKKSQTRVRGEVKAEFIDKSGIITKVTRAMEATRTETQIKFKTVDNLISKINKKTGQEYSMTHRCVDVDREVRESLGLSSAILNYVIFCHQDDANWPTTDDGKKLKERFDEIFDTSKYNKALEQIRKMIKEKSSTIRELTIKLNALSMIVDEVRAKEVKLKEYQSRRLQSAYDITETAKKLEPVKKKIVDINNLEKKHGDLTSEKKQKEHEVYLAEQELKTLEPSIKDFFDGSDNELRTTLKSYDDDLEQKMGKIYEVETNILNLSDKENKISKSLKEQNHTIGSFELQLSEQKRKTEERNNLLNEILTEWNMEPIDSQTSEGFIRNMIEEVNVKYQTLEKSLNDTQEKYDQEENEAEKKVDSLRNHRTKIDVELKRCEKEVSDIKRSIRDTEGKILKADDIQKKSNAVDKKLEETNKLIQKLSDEIVSTNYATTIDQTIKSLENIEEQANKADELMILLQNQNTTKAKIENLESEISRKNQSIEEFKKKYGQQLEDLLGANEIPKSNLRNTVNKFQQTLNERLKKLRQEVVQEQKKATTLETTVEHLRNEFRAKLAEIQCDKHKIATHCGDYKNYDGTMLTLSSKLKKLQDQRGMFAFQGTAYSVYVKKLSETDPCCPLCDRDFSKTSEAVEVVSKLKEEIKNHPNRLKNCEEELNKVKGSHETLLALKTTVEKIIKFEEVEKERMVKKIDENKAKLEALKKSSEDMQAMISGLEKKITICNNLSGYLAVWDQCLNEIERLEASYNEILLEIDDSNFREDKTIAEVQNEREELKQKKKEVQGEIASLRKKLDLQNEEIKKAKDLRSRVLEEQLSIHNEVQNLKQWRESLTQLLKKETELTSTIKNLQQQLIAAQTKLDNGLQELEDLKSEHRKQLDKVRKQLVEYSKRIDKLHSLHDEVIILQAKKIEIRLREIKKEMAENEKVLEDIKVKSTKFKQHLSECKEDVSTYELRKRNLMDNLKYRQYKSKVVDLNGLIKQITDQIEKLDIENAKKNLDFLKRQAEKLEKEINIAMGSEQELKYNISQLEIELQKEEYFTARNKYKSKWYEKAVTENIISDLQAYVKALDLAVTNHHEERMNSVNKSMKNLWNLIYTGTDTTSIQIRTDATVENKSRRQFNYKLVQIKHGAEMDMKGRCSAGQRVLASIVIRLALAQTFYDQCGMLALDEPTTNLDSHNASKLADTLYQYVSLHAADQKNFQLIIITHDANFIHKLSQLNKNGGFYELYRNNDGLTSIQYLSIDAENQRRLQIKDDGSDDESQIAHANSKTSTQSSSTSSSIPSKKRQISPSATQSSSKKPYNFKLN